MGKIENVQFEIDGDTGVIVLDNPPGNSLVRPEFISISLLRKWIDENQIKGILIHGNGRHFSGGADLDQLFRLAGQEEVLNEQMNRGKELLVYLENLDIPVVAAIDGICFGGGLEIALSCHIRVCSEKALFAFPEVNYGLMPGLGGIRQMVKQTSIRETLTMVLGGDMINAREAQAVGVADYVVNENTCFPFARDLLKKMTEGRKLKVIRSVMQAVHNAKFLSPEDAMHEETRLFCMLAKEEAERRMSSE